MSLITPTQGQRWVNNLTKAMVYIASVVAIAGERPRVIFNDGFNDTGTDMDVDKFVHEYSHDQFYEPGTAASLNVQDEEVRGMSKEFDDVNNFHQYFGLLAHGSPGHLSSGKLKERLEFLCEELEEFADAAGFELKFNLTQQTHTQDLPQQADALVDLVYVALGTAVMLGLPWDALWDDVQAANMRKVRGETKRGHKVDVTKPEGWVGPQTEQILAGFGYNPNEWPNALVEVNRPAANIRSERDDTER